MATTSSADDILAEVFQELENNPENVTINLDNLISSSAIADIQSKKVGDKSSKSRKSASSKHKMKSSSSKKRQKKNKTSAETTTTEKLPLTQNDEVAKSKEQKKLKSKRSHSSSKKRHHHDDKNEPSRTKKRKSDQSEKIEIETKRSKNTEKSVEKMYDEYENTMTGGRETCAIKAVPLETYLKSKGYLTDTIVETKNETEISNQSDLQLRKSKSTESVSQIATNQSTSSRKTFVPRNVKIKSIATQKNVEIPSKSTSVDEISEEDAKKSAPLEIDNISEKSLDDTEFSVVEPKNNATQPTETLAEGETKNCDEKITPEEDLQTSMDKENPDVKINLTEVAIEKGPTSMFPKRFTVGISEKTAALLSKQPPPKRVVVQQEEGEILHSDVSSINSPEVDVVDESDGEIKEPGEENVKRKKEKRTKRKKHKHESRSRKKKRKKSHSPSLPRVFDDSSRFQQRRHEFSSDRKRNSSGGGINDTWRHDRFQERKRWSRDDGERTKYYRRSSSPSDKFEKTHFFYHHRFRDDRSSRHRRSLSPRKSSIDKKQLYDIARRNASAMLQHGTLQEICTMSAQDIAKLKAGGTSVDELVDYCRKLQKKENRAANVNHNSDSSSDESVRNSEDDTDVVFRHPFALNSQQKNNIVFNVRNLTQLPVKTPAERAADDTKLKSSFPVSSGQQHRTKELEWVPVSPPSTSMITEKSKPRPSSKNIQNPTPTTSTPLAIEAAPQILPLPPPPLPPPVDECAESVFPETSKATPAPNIDIGEVVTTRLKAIRRLYDNPNDIEALKMMHFAEEDMKKWAESKNVPGAFLGGTGAVCLTPEQLAPRDPKFQAWAKKDQLTTCKPVASGVGMNLLQKMGWKPGEGLGKYKAGSLTPLLLDVKSDRKGLVSNEELSGKVRNVPTAVSKDLQGKHPVSVLMELCAKRHWNPPSFSCVENGPSHSRRFLWTVVVNGVEYMPATPTGNKKLGKAQAAQVVLQSLGLVPRDAALPVVIG